MALFPFQIWHNAYDDPEYALWVLAPSLHDLKARIEDYLKSRPTLIKIAPLPNTADFYNQATLDYITWSPSIAAEIAADLDERISQREKVAA